MDSGVIHSMTVTHYTRACCMSTCCSKTGIQELPGLMHHQVYSICCAPMSVVMDSRQLAGFYVGRMKEGLCFVDLIRSTGVTAVQEEAGVTVDSQQAQLGHHGSIYRGYRYFVRVWQSVITMLAKGPATFFGFCVVTAGLVVQAQCSGQRSLMQAAPNCPSNTRRSSSNPSQCCELLMAAVLPVRMPCSCSNGSRAVLFTDAGWTTVMMLSSM